MDCKHELKQEDGNDDVGVKDAVVTQQIEDKIDKVMIDSKDSSKEKQQQETMQKKKERKKKGGPRSKSSPKSLEPKLKHARSKSSPKTME